MTAAPHRPPTAGRVVLWRHGQTDYNVELRLQGQVDRPLNEIGLTQARAAARELAARVANLGARAHVVSSDLERARVTAHALLAELEERGMPTAGGVRLDERLRERAFGPWEGLTHPEISARWPEEFAVWRAGGDPDLDGLEPRGAASERVGAAVASLARELEPDDVLVVASHGAAISLAIVHLLGLDPTAWAGLRGMENCHWAVLRPNPGRTPAWALTTYNAGAAAEDVTPYEPRPDVAPGTGA